MKVLRRFWQEICLALLVSCLPFLFSRFGDSTSRLESNLLVLFIVANVCLSLLLLRMLWKKKWKLLFKKAARNVFSRVAKFLMRALEKFFEFWNLNLKNDTNVLYGKTTVSFEFDDTEKAKKSSKRIHKWKQMKSDRERLGHLYRHMINGQIRSGRKAYAFDTPSEIKARNSSEELENELFDLYIETRYDERAELDTEKIFDLKNRCEEIFDKVK